MLRVFVALLIAAPLAAQELPDAIKAVIDSPDYKGARWGILIADAKTGKTIYGRSADTLFAPASVTKLYSCAAALVALGPDHRFITPVYQVGDDLVLVASGDLTFGGRDSKDGKKTLWCSEDHIYTDGFSMVTELTDSNPLHAFDELAKQIKAAGITSVKGDVLIDDRLYLQSEGTGSGPKAVSPMMANDNLIDLIVFPGKKAGDPAKVTVRPETLYFKAEIDITTAESGPASFTVLDSDPRQYTVKGKIPLKSEPLVGIVPIRKPAEFARTLFIEALKREGVAVSAPLVRTQNANALPKDYDGKSPIAKFTSLPLSGAIEATLKVSHNLYASALPHLLAVKAGKGKTLASGMKAQGTVLKEIGIDVEKISFGGGAGGANADQVTPRITVDLLQKMRTRKEWESFKAGLPILAVDGTLVRVVDKDSPAKGKVFAKTGTLFSPDLMNDRTYLTSKAIAGVMTDAKGTELSFAIFVNGLPLPPGTRPTREGKVLGKLCEIIYEKGP